MEEEINMKERKRKAKRKEKRENLNNEASDKKDYSKSDTDNEDRIQNNISEHTKETKREKNTNVVKEKKEKKKQALKKQKKAERHQDEEEKENVSKNPNIDEERLNEVVGVFIHECEVLGKNFIRQAHMINIAKVIKSTNTYLFFCIMVCMKGYRETKLLTFLKTSALKASAAKSELQRQMTNMLS